MSGSAKVIGYGDFNNDLYNDVIVSDQNNARILIAIWNIDTDLFEHFWEQELSIVYTNIYLLDCNYDGRLDFVVYSEK